MFSGGIDTSFILTVAFLYNLNLRLFSATPIESPDYRYILSALEKVGRYELINVDIGSSSISIKNCIDISLEVLKTIDPVEIASAITVCEVLSAAKENGCKCIATGDGGDELFLGYNFLLNLSDEKIKEWSYRMAKGNARFNSKDLGKALGIRVAWPLYEENVRELSLKIPYRCKVNVYEDKKFGKYILRLFLYYNNLKGVAWREKTPIVFGSNSFKLLKEISLREVSEGLIEKIKKETRIKIPSKAHAYLLNRMLELDLPLPDKCEDPSRRCPICGSCLENNHCRFCGAYVREDGTVEVYKD